MRALVAVLLLAATPSPPPPPLFERAILVRQPGRVAFLLDRDVYEGARSDLGDLRVVDDQGRWVAFLLDRGAFSSRTRVSRAAVRNRGWRSDGALSAVLDFEERTRRTRLRLELSGDNFRRRVSVEGSEDGVAWVTLVDEAWVFAVPGDGAARYETLALPENDFPHLRVTVRPGDGERERVELRVAEAPASGGGPRERARLCAFTAGQTSEKNESWLSLDLGARHQPFHGLELEAREPRFFREVVVDARRDPLTRGGPIEWVEIGRGVLYRLEHRGRVRESLRLDVGGRERALRIRIRHGDDRPLAVTAVRILEPIERVAFEAEPGRSYRLTYGTPQLGAPSFDLARTVEEPLPWADVAVEASLGHPRRTLPPAEDWPWTERHPALLWGVLSAVVLVLGGLTWRALRGTP